MKKGIFILGALFLSFCAQSQTSILAEEAANHIGQTLTVCGKVFGARYLESTASRPTLLNVGGNFPNHHLTVLIRDEDRKNFAFKPEEKYINQNICITGELIDYKGKPELIVSAPTEITVSTDLAVLEKRKKDVIIKPEPKSLEPTSEKVPEKNNSTYSVQLTSDVNLREGPSKEDKIVATAKAATEVVIYKSGNGWSRVSIQQEVGGEIKTLYGFIKNSVLK